MTNNKKLYTLAVFLMATVLTVPKGHASSSLPTDDGSGLATATRSATSNDSSNAASKKAKNIRDVLSEIELSKAHYVGGEEKVDYATWRAQNTTLITSAEEVEEAYHLKELRAYLDEYVDYLVAKLGVDHITPERSKTFCDAYDLIIWGEDDIRLQFSWALLQHAKQENLTAIRERFAQLNAELKIGAEFEDAERYRVARNFGLGQLCIALVYREPAEFDKLVSTAKKLNSLYPSPTDSNIVELMYQLSCKPQERWDEMLALIA